MHQRPGRCPRIASSSCWAAMVDLLVRDTWKCAGQERQSEHSTAPSSPRVGEFHMCQRPATSLAFFIAILITASSWKQWSFVLDTSAGIGIQDFGDIYRLCVSLCLIIYIILCMTTWKNQRGLLVFPQLTGDSVAEPAKNLSGFLSWPWTSRLN